MGCSPQLTVLRSESAINGYCKVMYGGLESDNHQYFSYYEKDLRNMPQHQWVTFEERLQVIF